MRKKQGLWIVAALVAVAVALFVIASSLTPVEHTARLQTALAANANVVCVERPDGACDGDTLVVATAHGVTAVPIVRPVRLRCSLCVDMVCRKCNTIVRCF